MGGFKLKTFGAPVLLLGYKYLNIEPGVTQARQAFGLSVALCLLTCAFLYSKILKAKQTAETQTVKVKSKTMQGEDKEETKTFLKHDVDELMKLVKQTAIGAVIVIGLHLWKGYMQPVVFQALMLPLTMIDHQLFHIFVLGRPATGDLERPWKEDNPFAAFAQQAQDNGNSGQEGEGEGKAGSGTKKSKKESKKAK